MALQDSNAPGGSTTLRIASHPWRETLSRELHARPFGVVPVPAQLFHFALTHDSTPAETEIAHLATLCAARRHAPPAEGAIHFSADFDDWRLTWERHSEFSTYSLVVPGGSEAPGPGGDARLPAAWLAGVSGRLIAATRIRVGDEVPDAATIDGWFGGRSVVGGLAAGGRARVWTDFDLDAGGFLRVWLRSGGMPPRQTGRLVQRLLEIHAYTAMALLALPMAREIAAGVGQIENSLADVADTVSHEFAAGGEQPLLRRLSQLAAEVEALAARTSYRFNAARAYHALVARRVAELREQRIEGEQTIGEFLDRRFAPAMRTCEAMQRRLEALSARVARASEMLRTRIDVTLAAQNRDLLASMERRARLQLRLQSTVEGLSVAAITYYASGLLSHLVDAAAEASGATLPTELVVGGAIPVIALLCWLGVRRVRRSLGPH
jgi:uncharacterized membrane-anchored protein